MFVTSKKDHSYIISFLDCEQDQFKCQMGGGCIPIENKCDGIAQCADKSDEWDCLRLNVLGNSLDKKILQVGYSEYFLC